MAHTQDTRVCQIKTPLGSDALLVEHLTVSESISRLFQIDLDLLSPKGGIEFNKIVGEGVAISIELEGGGKRHFHGFVSSFAQGGIVQGTGVKGEAVRLVAYHAQVVPWLWFLTRNADCRIFQDKTVPDILQQVFKDRGFSDFKVELHGSFEPRNYCVQYRETDFNFVSRLMEEEGIAYWFEHHADKHVMVLANTPSGFAKCEGKPTAEYSTKSGADSQAGEVEDWYAERELHPGKYAITDYNFETPSTSLLSSTSTNEAIGGNKRFEIFDYATEHKNSSEGTRKVKLRMEIEEAGAVRSSGHSTCAPFCAGQRFTLKGHYDDAFNKEYLLTGVKHSVSQGVGRAGSGDGGSYSNTFACILYSIPFRPQPITPKPAVQGCQPAIVCGPGGEEIYVDKYGRVKVQFYWDRQGKKDEHSSCWVRVSQPWAGKSWGAVAWPRIGQEVLVDFIEGDPDRPVIIGRVYNAEQMPPYGLPGNMTQSGLKSRSSKGGDGSNEIRFEDKKSSEEIFIHAQKDQNIVVEHDETIKIGNNRSEDVGKDETISIEHDRSEKVGNNETISIGKDRITDIGKDETLTVAGNRSETISKDEKLEVTGKREVGIGKTDELNVGKTFTLVAGDQIKLKTGDATITMKKDGTIEIKGKDVKITGSGKVDVKASSDVTIKGSKISQN